ncbi:MAG: CRISPR-associated helicase Cas3' [Opitutae bacterium]|nr:CRISPR-associated helicase Cas3' [Opitutae bacterium]
MNESALLRFDALPPIVRALWAKSGDPLGHGLLCHMLDVAAVAEELLHREPPQTLDWIAEEFCLPRSHAEQWLAMIVGLHDFGKAIPGFQCKWEPGRRADEDQGLAFTPVSLAVSRHDLASTALLRRALSRIHPAAAWIGSICQALGAHHGYMPRVREFRDALPRAETQPWRETREALLDAYLRTLSMEDAPTSGEITLPALAWLAGLTSVADWIGSNQEWFPPGEAGEALVEYHQLARERARRALDSIGWSGFQPLLAMSANTDTLIRRMLDQPELSARPLQQVGDRLLDNATGPTLLIVEAPMGEGKTELAFLAHLRLQARNGHRGLYVALPTQATGNALFGRMLRFLQAQAVDRPVDVQLVHGGAAQHEPCVRLRNIGASEDEAVTSSAWFSQRKRPLLSPYGVGTIDQALFATLNVKHHFVRLWGLANRVVVLDEVHAYDTYTSGLIEALLRWLKAMRCSVVLMSATLPTRSREGFLRAWGADAAAAEMPYPRLWMTRADEVIGEHVPCRALAPIAVQGVSEELPEMARHVLASLDGEGCGAVIVNTVQRAQDMYRLLKDQLGSDTDLMLFHARYPADERGQREAQVLRNFGRGDDARRPRRAVLVATQVVEQSLDLDFDFMLTDLAPVDLVLQRAGRLHRHERPRPAAHQNPCLTIAGLLPERPPELTETAWGFVYDPYILYRTWSFLRNEALWRLPEDIDRLVQAVYGQEDIDGDERADFIKTLDHAFGEHIAKIQRQRQQAVNVAIDAEAEPQNAYVETPRANEDGEGEGRQVVTRLGAESLTVVPVLVNAEGWRLRPDDTPFRPDTDIGDDLARRIARRQMRISRRDIVVSLASSPMPRGFAQHPLLRHLHPLELHDGWAEFGRLRVRLDPELGLVYETTENP